MFEPDIIVTGPEPSDIALVAEVKTSSRSVDDSERQLKSYIAAVSSPVGLLVTPEHVRIYRDQYLPSGDSIIRVGEFDLRDIIQFEKSGNAAPMHLVLSVRSNPGWRRCLPNPALSN